jgi:hypothetical protein
VESDLRASVRHIYRLPGKRLLLLDDGYEGGVEAGDWIELSSPAGTTMRVQVDSVAWGSSFKALNPPLTLVCKWGNDPDPEPGSKVRSVSGG